MSENEIESKVKDERERLLRKMKQEDEEHEHMIVYMAPVVHNLKVFFCIPLPFFIKTMAVCFTIECALNVFQMVEKRPYCRTI